MFFIILRSSKNLIKIWKIIHNKKIIEAEKMDREYLVRKDNNKKRKEKQITERKPKKENIEEKYITERKHKEENIFKVHILKTKTEKIIHNSLIGIHKIEPYNTTKINEQLIQQLNQQLNQNLKQQNQSLDSILQDMKHITFRQDNTNQQMRGNF